MISLAGLSGSLLMWGAVVGGVSISLLYLLRLRRRRVVVPFLPLWQRVVKQNQYRSLWQRLKRLLSWLIQMLFWLLLLVALGDPRLRAELLSGRNLVVVIDVSASMRAKEKEGSRLALARKQAETLIKGLIGFDRMMIVAMDREVVPLTPFTSDKRLLRERIAQLRTSDTPAELRKALLLAQDALKDRKRGEIIVISDGAFGEAYTSLLKSDKKNEGVDTNRASPETQKPTPRAKGKTKENKQAARHKPPKRRATAKRKASKKRKSKKKRRRRSRNKRRQPPPRRIVLPPGIAKQLDVKRFATMSEALRPLPRFQMVRVGKVSGNVGIIAMSARRTPAHPLHFAVYVELQNFGDNGILGFLDLYVDGAIVRTEPVSLKASQRWRYTFPKVVAKGQKLKAELRLKRGKNLLRSDDRAYAVLPKTRVPRVLLVSPENLYLYAVFLSNAQNLFRQIPCKAYRDELRKQYDIVVFNGCAPDEAPTEGRFIFFNPPSKGTPFRIDRRARRMLKKPLITEVKERHPTMMYTDWDNVNISVAARFRLQRGDTSLASSFGKPLVVAHQSKKLMAIGLGFALARSDLPWRMAFPLFVRNSLDWLIRGGRPLPPTTRTTGQRWKIRVNRDVRELLLEGPGLTPMLLPVNQGEAYFSGKRAGFYKISYGKQSRWLAANLANPAESRIKPQTLKPKALIKADPKAKVESSNRVTVFGFKIPMPRKIWSFLLLLGVILLAVEWLTYNRRITV